MSDAAHHPSLQHHFVDLGQQKEAAALGMWDFIAQEVLFFGGLFLLKLRQETAALRRGRTVNLHVADKTWAYARVLDGQAAVVGINTGPKAETLDLEAAPAGLADGRRLRDRTGSLGEAVVEGGRLRLVLPPGSSGVFVP